KITLRGGPSASRRRQWAARYFHEKTTSCQQKNTLQCWTFRFPAPPWGCAILSTVKVSRGREAALSAPTARSARLFPPHFHSYSRLCHFQRGSSWSPSFGRCHL